MKADVTLRVLCLMPEKLIGRALSQGARFARLRRADERTLIVQCDGPSAQVLLELCRRYSIPARVLSRRGTSAAARFLRSRGTLAVGLIVCIALCWLFLGRVWAVDAVLSGESADLGDLASLEAALERFGVRPGISRRLDVGLLSQALRSEAGDYSYVSAHLQGVRLLVEAVPEVPAPGLYQVDAPRDLVSDRDGIVVSAKALAGELCVSPGDAVLKGQLLIRGEELADSDQTRPIAALGEVVVRSWVEGETALALYERRPRFTGRSATSSSLKIFGFSLPILEATGFDSQQVFREYLPIGGLFLPLEIERETCRELEYTQKARDEAGLRDLLSALAVADARLRLQRQESGPYEIVRTWIDFESDAGTMRARAVCEIHTDAAITREALNRRPSEIAG